MKTNGTPTYLGASGGQDDWRGWGGACRCHPRRFCPCLLQLLCTASGASGALMTPAHLRARERERDRGGGVSAAVFGSDTEGRSEVRTGHGHWVHAGLTAAQTQKGRKKKKSKIISAVSAYFWVCACRRNINNRWAQRLWVRLRQQEQATSGKKKKKNPEHQTFRKQSSLLRYLTAQEFHIISLRSHERSDQAEAYADTGWRC